MTASVALRKPSCCSSSPTERPENQIRNPPSSASRSLLQSYRLHQIARTINVQAALHRHVIREQLQRHNLQDWRQQFRRMRDEDVMVRELRHFCIAFRGQRNHPAGLLLESSNIAERLLVWKVRARIVRVPSRNDYDWEVLFD